MMKAEIKEAIWQREKSNPHDPNKMLHDHKIVYLDENLDMVTGYYTSIKKEQTNFKVGETAEFDVQEMIGKEGRKWFKIRPQRAGGGSLYYNRSKKIEQSKYAGFSLSYAKDLVVAGKLNYDQLLTTSEKMFWHMVSLDKKLES